MASHHPKSSLPPAGSISRWAAGQRPATFPPLSEDAETDVCIVGAGITGLTLAYLLSATHRVLVLEKDFVGAGDTGRSSAHVTRVLDDDYAALARRFGERGARTAAAAHGAAIDFIERLAAEESIDCDFERVDGFLVGEPGEDERLEKMRDGALAAGIEDAVFEVEAPFEKRHAAPAIRFPRQAQMDPWLYVQGLARAVARRGGVIHTGTPVARLSDGTKARAWTAHGPFVRASAIVLATHAPLGGKPGIHARLEAYRTYVIAGPVPKGAVPRVLLWDTSSPYHYVRTANRSDSEDLLLVGGEDHRTGSPGDGRPYEKLESWARGHYPSLGPIEHRWSGQVFEPSGGLGFVGGSTAGSPQFYSTGHSGNGLTHGTLSAVLLAFLLRDGEHDHEWGSIFDPGRMTFDAALQVARQGVAAVAGLGERFTAEELHSSDQVLPGTAAVVGRGNARRAVYREPGGRLWECSALCTHMGCVVRWNSAERSWDCPCHGSRFDASGRVLEGPASQDLAPVSPVHAR
jgi:glycine/D-amino acid oxidase-like deaminating enzyme/nitrite reductase/ring-hydroxylating ferredoxin subunit